MDAIKAIGILEALASGCSPITGEFINNESVLYDRDVIRALQFAIDRLEAGKKIKSTSGAESKPDYSQIDFFRKEKFNRLSAADMKKLASEVTKLGTTKTENLPPYQQMARKTFARAYEPWSSAEKSLFADAIKSTNDVELLSQLFQRGKGSVQSFGLKLIYEQEQAQ